MIIGLALLAAHALQSALDPNPTLARYTAKAQLEVRTHAALPISKHFSGTETYVRPKDSITFERVPGFLRQFQTLSTTPLSYQQARTQFTIGKPTDDGTQTTFVLVPKAADSRVKTLSVVVGDRDGLVARYEWIYTNGSDLRIEPQYTKVGAYRLPQTIVISAHFPSYHVDGKATFSDYVFP